MKKLWAGVSVLLMVFTLVACSSKKPEDVAISFVEAGYKGDADTMLSLIALPDDQKNQAGVEEMMSGKIKIAAAKFKEKADNKGGVKQITIGESNIDEANSVGKVQVITKFKNEGSQDDRTFVRLIKSKDEWKVNL